MRKLDVAHFLDLYQTRKEMQEKGITNPPQEIKDFTAAFVEKLSKMPPDEEVKMEGNSLIDSKGKVIATFPTHKREDQHGTL